MLAYNMIKLKNKPPLPQQQKIKPQDLEQQLAFQKYEEIKDLTEDELK